MRGIAAGCFRLCKTWAMAVALLAPLAPAGAAPGVLILHSNQRPTPAGIVIEETLRATIPAAFKRPVEIYSEYLDLEVPATAALVTEQIRFLAQKYGGRDIEALVASGPGSVGFGSRLRESMASAAPIVHVAIPADTAQASHFPEFVVGRPFDVDPTPTIELAQRLHPDLQRVVVVVGATERDHLWERRVRAAVERMAHAPAFEYLSGLPTADILRRVGRLPPGTVVYTPGYFIDGAGEAVTPRVAVERIAKASAVPVYGALDTALGTGIVGGAMTPYEDQARDAGLIVARLLGGAAPGEIDGTPVARVILVDWRELRRWRIDEGLLPPGTIVRYREPGLWERYKLELGILAAVLIVQAALIAALLLERSSRRRTATALQERDAQMQLAAGAARLASWTWQVERDRHASRQAPRNDANPTPFDRVLASVHPADRAELQRSVSQAIATGDELDLEYREVGPGGAVRWISARGRAEAGNSRHLFGISLDVTERKLAELRATEDRDALRRMSRVSMMGQLSAAIAHQLHQPLAAILGNAETAQKMLRRGELDVAELDDICNDIVSEDKRAAEVIRRLGELYKQDRKEAQRVDLNDLVRETLDLLRTELVVRHVVARMDLASGLPAIDGDRIQLQQVILNLVLNAADAMAGMQGEREVVLRTDVAGSDVRLAAVDSGPGIADGELDRVFEPLWTTKAGGMGMGLAICRSIATAHRGSIAAMNNATRGATFLLLLPAATA